MKIYSLCNDQKQLIILQEKFHLLQLNKQQAMSIIYIYSSLDPGIYLFISLNDKSRSLSTMIALKIFSPERYQKTITLLWKSVPRKQSLL